MKRLILLAMFAVSAWAQTAINDTLYLQDSAPWNGYITVSWPAFTNCSGTAIAKGRRDYAVNNGTVSITLFPTDCASPSFAYSAVYYSKGMTWSETWAIPSSPSIVTLRGVRQSSTMSVFLGQLAQSGATDSQVATYNATTGKWEPRSVAGITGNVTSVAGRTGDVVIAQSDIAGLAAVLAAKMAAVSGSGVVRVTSGTPALVTGTSTDCVRVDGTSGACGTGAGGPANTDALAEGTSNLYFTQARARTALAGLYQTAITGAPGTWPTFAAVATSGVKADVGLGNADNTSDLNKPISTATSTALNGKVDTTRQVAGHPLSADVTVSKGDVGLGNADNSSDVNKPVSTATQTALDAKSPVNNPVFTGTLTLGTGGLIAPPGTPLEYSGAPEAPLAVPAPNMGEFALFLDSTNSNHLTLMDSGRATTDLQAAVTGGTGAYAAPFTAATTWTVTGATHGLGTCDIVVGTWDTAAPTQRVEPDKVTCDSSTYTVVVSWATAQAGRLVLVK